MSQMQKAAMNIAKIRGGLLDQWSRDNTRHDLTLMLLARYLLALFEDATLSFIALLLLGLSCNVNLATFLY